MSNTIMQTTVAGEIVEVEDASYDPEVGQSVRLAVRVATVDTGVAIANANVVFEALPGPVQVRVTTDSEGWAAFVYKATAQGNTQVTALVEGSQSKTASHTFDVMVVKAGVWDDARIMFNNITTNEARWGEKSVFPRITSATHIITLKAATGSALRNYNVQLGVMSESSLAELGITDVSPALGTARLLTDGELSWMFTVSATAGGAYFLVLAADRLINQSAKNHMSLGPAPAPSAALPADIVYRLQGTQCEIKASEVIVKLPLGSLREFSITVPPECLGESVSFRHVGNFDLGSEPGLYLPRTFSEETLLWKVMASRVGISEYTYWLTFSGHPDSPQLLRFVVE